MSEPLPKWIMRSYSVLWSRFNSNNFGYSDAFKILNNDNMISIILSKLRKSDWLVIQLDQKDARKRIYHLRNPEEVIRDMAVKGGSIKTK